MIEGVMVVSFVSLSLCSIWHYYWPSLNRSYRPLEVDSVEERCYHLNRPLRLFGGRHCYLVATSFQGNKLRLDLNESTGEVQVQRDYYDGWPHACYRKRNALPGLLLEDVAAAFRKRAEMAPFCPKKHCCQHVARDTLNDVSGREERELRSERLQLIAHFQAFGSAETLLGGKEIYAHRLNLDNSPYSSLSESEFPPKDAPEAPDRPFILDFLYEVNDFRPIE